MAVKKSNATVRIDTLTHNDTRANIPTEELRDFVADDEQQPGKMLYPRDPSLDPQLVWKGKDEQDREDLAVPTVPIYIQEKVQPRAIIEDLRAHAPYTGDHKDRPYATDATPRRGEPRVRPPRVRPANADPDSPHDQPQQISLFSDFDGLDWEQQIEFYQHEQHWTNRMILGDSLLVMNSLAEKEDLKGKVQCIYIDPPYGIKFGSNWQVSTRKRDVKDGRAEDATRQPEQVRAFRDTWKLGIHSYLAYLRDRLTVARELLTESGSVFVQIGDENVHRVRCLLDEIFGDDNFCSIVSFLKTSGQSSPTAKTNVLASVGDFILWYAKDKSLVKYRRPFNTKTDKTVEEQYNWIDLSDGSSRRLTDKLHLGDKATIEGRRFKPADPTSATGAQSIRYPFDYKGKTFLPPGNRGWSTTVGGMHRLASANRLMVIGDTLTFKRFLDDYPVSPIPNFWTDTIISGFADPKVYVVQTSTKVSERCLLMTTDPGDLVLDPTCGSGTTAYVAEQWGRRWITADTSRVALALARTRMMAARYPYYLLADSPEGIRKEAETTGKTPPTYPTYHDVRKGFVYKRVPHVTLKSIANNPDIREGLSREQIDAAIARHADTELLYDQPYEDNKRLRVTGPFTVESLSPHRVLAADDERPASESKTQDDPAAPGFEATILDNLKAAGVQNTVKNERLNFDRLEPFAGAWVHAVGEYTDKDNIPRRVAVSLGPEHGTVGSTHVKEAAKEAMRGAGFDLLVVCGFAFEAHAGETAKEFAPTPSNGSRNLIVAEETRQYGKLPILLARMNPDLAMGDELLKKTGAGNLFTVFGEPDLNVHRQDGKLTVTINGVDVYDPTTGQIRSSSTDDIACWFVDTDYNEESFFVRHAYFTGADQPYDKLKRALKAEIDEAAWSTLYSTTSRPFDPPTSGKIAVKVINHYGDEVLKVYDVKS